SEQRGPGSEVSPHQVQSSGPAEALDSWATRGLPSRVSNRAASPVPGLATAACAAAPSAAIMGLQQCLQRGGGCPSRLSLLPPQLGHRASYIAIPPRNPIRDSPPTHYIGREASAVTPSIRAIRGAGHLPGVDGPTLKSFQFGLHRSLPAAEREEAHHEYIGQGCHDRDRRGAGSLAVLRGTGDRPDP